jgi:hypothetical protein
VSVILVTVKPLVKTSKAATNLVVKHSPMSPTGPESPA